MLDTLLWYVLFPALAAWGILAGFAMAVAAVIYTVWKVYAEPWAFWRYVRTGKRWWQR